MALHQVEEISIDYTDCFRDAPTGSFEDIPGNKVSKYFKPSNYTSSAQPARWRRNETTQTFDGVKAPLINCFLQFDIENDIGPPVLMYYRLTEFYQNHRRYVRSFDMDQLKGHARSNSSIDGSDCDPLRTRDGKAIYPCGLIANSLFNDTFEAPIQINAQNRTYNMVEKGIAWEADRDLYGKSDYTNDQVVPPPNWKVRYPHGYTDSNPIPNLQENEPFQVWMRTAGLPTFSKLALRNDNEPMRSGRYLLTIQDSKSPIFLSAAKSPILARHAIAHCGARLMPPRLPR
jgi:hypothetical protein